jgi:hypothetical protein
MNLDEQLRAALNLEAEMQTAPRPDVDELLSGGRVRRRHRNATLLGVSVAAVVLFAGAAYGATRIDVGDARTGPGIADQPSGSAAPPAYRDTNGGPLEPGTYRIRVGEDAAGALNAADVTFEGSSWMANGYPLAYDGRYAGMGIYQPVSLAGGSGCSDDWTARPAGETPQDVARQLTRIPRSTVLQPATATDAFGRSAMHLQLRINDRCPAGSAYVVAKSADGGRGITYSSTPQDVVIDFWVVDLNGTPVVVDEWRQVDASSTIQDAATHARESISFTTLE